MSRVRELKQRSSDLPGGQRHIGGSGSVSRGRGPAGSPRPEALGVGAGLGLLVADGLSATFGILPLLFRLDGQDPSADVIFRAHGDLREGRTRRVALGHRNTHSGRDKEALATESDEAEEAKDRRETDTPEVGKNESEVTGRVRPRDNSDPWRNALLVKSWLSNF
jgi:hypothetical protein